MDPKMYLQKLLASQSLPNDGDEMEQLRLHREEVEDLIREKLSDCKPVIRYGGSKAKGTMIKESYDLDILCYFEADDRDAGDSLKEVYNNIYKIMQAKFHVDRKKTALRLKDPDTHLHNGDYHIDLVPGRYTDISKSDVYLHQEYGSKNYLKSNPDVHIEHVRDSGVRDAIKVMKFWNVRNRVDIKTFVLELLVIELLKKKKDKELPDQVIHVLTEIRDHTDSLILEDPANPTGNDLTELWDSSTQDRALRIADTTLWNIENLGWEGTFGPIEEGKVNKEILFAAAASVSRRTKPWA